ncbi:MAG TPA: cysteine desulfurase [Alphaproteobacteria bacterium]|nr:cysteine desulfurase [Alphaproteobacteria bacterium]
MTETARKTAPLLRNVKFDVERVRTDFPILAKPMRGKPLVFLDSAASAQKPQAVIDAVSRTYEQDYANVHRAVYELSDRATALYEGARKKVARYINARSEREVIYVRGTTEAINLVAQSWGRANLKAGDEILSTGMEHHSNIVPWQMLRDTLGVKLVVAPIDLNGDLIMDEFRKRLSSRTRLVAFAHVSNALGTVNPVEELVALAHKAGALALVDGAQGIPHFRVDVQALGCDFYAFSGHKLYGPTGTGALWGREELLNAMPPWQGGGDMIRSVTFEKTEYNDLPYKFEAGTPAIADAIGLGAAVDYIEALPWDAVEAHEAEVLAYGAELLRAIPGLKLIGESKRKAGVLSFVIDGIHPHDIGTVLDSEGIAVRTGHHCAQPVMDFFGIPATARASLGLYTNRADMEALARGVHKVKEFFHV